MAPTTRARAAAPPPAGKAARSGTRKSPPSTKAACTPAQTSEPGAVSRGAFFKIINETRQHREMEYVEGKNVCAQQFDRRMGHGGGLYGCPLKSLLKWLPRYKFANEVAVLQAPEGPECEFEYKDGELLQFKAKEIHINQFMSLERGVALAICALSEDPERRNEVADALNACAWRGRARSVRAILAAGHSPGVCVKRALFVAAMHGHAETVRAFLGAAVGCNVSAPLIIAATRGHAAVVEVFCEHYKTPSERECRVLGRALRAATSKMHVDVVLLLKARLAACC
jgi:hypothetical protein